MGSDHVARLSLAVDADRDAAPMAREAEAFGGGADDEAFLLEDRAERVRDVVVLALDIGGTKLAAGVVTGDGRVLSRAVAPALAHEGPWSMIDRHVELGRRVVAATTSSSGIPAAISFAIVVARSQTG